jgi:hypothetical protein
LDYLKNCHFSIKKQNDERTRIGDEKYLNLKMSIINSSEGSSAEDIDKIISSLDENLTFESQENAFNL